MVVTRMIPVMVAVMFMVMVVDNWLLVLGWRGLRGHRMVTTMVM